MGCSNAKKTSDPQTKTAPEETKQPVVNQKQTVPSHPPPESAQAHVTQLPPPPAVARPAQGQGQAEVVFFLGGPGSGKGTQCQRLVETGKWVHLSTGDLLREERKSGSKDAEMIETYLKDGKLVPSELLVGLVRKAMQQKGWSTKRFLIDGYPRNEENIRVWEQQMPDVKVLCLLFLECSNEVLTERILGRNQGRSDDNPESLKKRLAVFEGETRPVLEIWRAKGGNVEVVNGEGSTEEVYAQITSKLPS